MLFSIVCIFEEKPEQWGLRGDPYLWEDMKKEFTHRNVFRKKRAVHSGPIDCGKTVIF